MNRDITIDLRTRLTHGSLSTPHGENRFQGHVTTGVTTITTITIIATTPIMSRFGPEIIIGTDIGMKGGCDSSGHMGKYNCFAEKPAF